MCTDTFPDRNVYAQKFVHTHKCLRTEFFTHRTFYTHKLLHAQFFAHISFYKLNLHCTQGNFYTEKSFTQRIYTKKSLYTKKPLRTKTVTRKSFYTEVFTHIGHIRFTRGNFDTETNLATDQLCDNCKINSILFFDVRSSCRAE